MVFSKSNLLLRHLAESAHVFNIAIASGLAVNFESPQGRHSGILVVSGAAALALIEIRAAFAA